MMTTVSFLPIEALDELIRATGFEPGESWKPEYRHRWLLERIGIMKEQATLGAIAHNYPDQKSMTARLEMYMRWETANQNTLACWISNMEDMRRKVSCLEKEIAEYKKADDVRNFRTKEESFK